MTPEALTDYLHRHIPLTVALGARVTRCADGEVEIAAPLAPNLNHRNTVFGGSLAALGILAGWAVLHRALAREHIAARLVVQHSQCEFTAPVARDFSVIGRLPDAAWKKFLGTLRRYRRARITLRSEIFCGSAAAVTHDGTYVALTGDAA